MPVRRVINISREKLYNNERLTGQKHTNIRWDDGGK